MTNALVRLRRRVRVSIRVKLLVALVSLLSFAVATHGYLAVSTFTRDKLAYVYDVNNSTVVLLREQTQATLEVLSKALHLFANEATRRGATARSRSASAAELFAVDPDLVRVEIFAPGEAGAEPQLISSAVNPEALAALELGSDDLPLLRRDHPIPLADLVRRPGELLVVNASLPPAAALLTLAFATADRQAVVVGDLRHERLLRAVAQGGGARSFLVDGRGVALAHPESEVVIGHRDLSSVPLVAQALRGEVDQGVLEFVADGEDQLGAFARVGNGGLWVCTFVSKAEALQAATELIRRTVLFGIAVLLAALIASVWVSRLITSPIRRLRAATERVGQGQLEVRTEVDSNDEIGDLARAFERMAGALKEVQAQLIQSEKMAAFGQLGAGITHEVKNPMTGIISFAQLAQRKLDDQAKLLEFLKLIEKEALRCRDILVNFLKFARASTRDLEPIEPNELVDAAGAMVRHQLNIHNVRLAVELGDGVPPILANAPELQQVLLNLALNAQQAMAGGGHLWLRTRRDEQGWAVIEVQDDGPGIPAELHAKIFEPFFTTKPSGEGTGLGLSVSFGIVKAHNGTLRVDSAPGRGATFLLSFPPATGSAAKA